MQRAEGRPGLRGKGIIVLIILLAMAPPLSSDMYMPGLPMVAEDLHTTQTLTSNTLTAFFLFMATGALFIGGLSDKYGRRPVLIASIAVALVSCLLCATATSIWMLLALRALHGIGSGGMIAMATALAKDYFSGVQMARVIGFTQAASMLAPVASPVIGVAVLTAAGWRATFVAIAACLSCSLVLALFLKEPLSREARAGVSLGDVFIEMKDYLGQFGFMSLLVVGACVGAPFMAYLGVASFVYEEYFGFTEVQFSAAFVATAITSVVGPLCFAKFTKRYTTDRLVFVMLAASAVCAVGMVAFGAMSPFAFLPVMMVYAVLATTVRPLITNALLAPLRTGVGAASSLINFLLSGGGCIGMIVGSAGWTPVVLGVQVAMAAFIGLGVAAFFVRQLVLKRKG